MTLNVSTIPNSKYHHVVGVVPDFGDGTSHLTSTAKPSEKFKDQQPLTCDFLISHVLGPKDSKLGQYTFQCFNQR